MKARLTVLVFAFALLATACTPEYSSAHDFGNPFHVQVKPQFEAIHMQTVDTGSIPSDAHCAVALTVSGVAAIVAVGTGVGPPAGVAAWAVFGTSVGTSLFGLGDWLLSCLNQYSITKTAWDVIIQCPVNKPTLVRSFDDYNQATAYISLQSCTCSFACLVGEEDPLTYAPGLNFSSLAYGAGKHYFHDGANHVEGPTTGEPPPPPDYQAIADQLQIPWEGQCAEYRPSDNLCGTQ